MSKMDHFSSVDRVLGSFALDLAIYGHQFDRISLLNQRRKIEERDRRQAEAEAQLLREEERKAEQLRKSQQQKNIAQENALKPEVLAQEDPMFPIIFQHFANELRPAILKKYPAAPADKVNKVILAKWGSIDPVKKQAFIKKVLRIIQAQKTAPASQPKQQEGTSPQQTAKQVQEQVMVKQEAVEEPVAEDRFDQFLSRVNQNVRGMQEESHKEEQGEPMQEEGQKQQQGNEQNQEQTPQEEDDKQKMQEEQ